MTEYRLLHIEDSADDQVLTARHLAQGGLRATIDVVDTLDGVREAIRSREYDAVLADFELDGFNGIDALVAVRECDRYVPFILVSGEVGEHTAVQLMRAGAQDFVMKDALARLIPVIEREVGEAQVRRERDAAEQANIIKSEFLASMSHELRTPLNSIIGFTDILLSGMAGELNEEQQRQIAMVHSAGKQLLALVNDILDLSKIEAGKLELEASPFRLGDLLAEVREQTRAQWEAKGLSFDLVGDPDEIEMDTDLRALGQVLRNLVGNAIKFTEHGGLAMGFAADANGTVSLSVSDTGPGISREELSLIFDEFHQTHKAREFGGTGLGLAISRRLAQELGGDIHVQSEEGVGSTFTLVVPLCLPLRPADAMGCD